MCDRRGRNGSPRSTPAESNRVAAVPSPFLLGLTLGRARRLHPDVAVEPLAVVTIHVRLGHMAPWLRAQVDPAPQGSRYSQDAVLAPVDVQVERRHRGIRDAVERVDELAGLGRAALALEIDGDLAPQGNDDHR